MQPKLWKHSVKFVRGESSKMNQKLKFLIVLNFVCYNAKSIEDCKCSTLVNKFKLGNCLETVPSKVMCYLRKDSKCPDSSNSKIYPKRKFSKLACKLQRNTQSTNEANNVKFKIILYLFMIPIFGAVKN